MSKIHPPLLFLDTESLGLGDAPLWEVAAIYVNEYGGIRSQFSMFLKHDAGDWFDTLPEPFQEDYLSRFVPDEAIDPVKAVLKICKYLQPGTIVCGSNPSFDTSRLERIAVNAEIPAPSWHYHSEDVPTLARGWLNGKGVYPAPPWKSDIISQMIGVDPREFDRHTAMGDCEWSLAMWERVTKP